MIDGKILPAPPIILSATIALTFITPSGKSKFLLPKMLHVQRHKIREALLWLKAHNLMYKDIIISEEQLEALPENGTPNEILSTAKYSTDMESVTREHKGYVPLDAADEKEDGTYVPIIRTKHSTDLHSKKIRIHVGNFCVGFPPK